MKKMATATLCAALLMGAAVPASAAERAPRAEAGVYASNGDYVHVSSTKPATASAHGWWFKVKGPGSKAKVTIWLQTRKIGHLEVAHGRQGGEDRQAEQEAQQGSQHLAGQRPQDVRQPPGT
ncbi:hypothetical protein ACIO13_32375 [Streptomyces sp. NPDC087425]|uniref:hypothetical protein n=1 Tax=Streptomyces sp. NPDC087425 TaxID=3365787 RepID=UPI0038071AB2